MYSSRHDMTALLPLAPSPCDLLLADRSAARLNGGPQRGLRRDLLSFPSHIAAHLPKLSSLAAWLMTESEKMAFSSPQVNAREFSKVDHEGTVAEAIRRDPIVVQVLRRNPARAAAPSASQDVPVTDVCTQTDITFEHIMALAKLRPATPPVPDVCPFLLSDR